MSHRIRMPFLLLVALVVQVAVAGERMTAELAVPADAQAGKVILTVRNDGDTDVTVSMFKVPSWSTGELHGDVFQVRRVGSSQPVEYTGFQDNPGPPTPRNFFVMAPGDARTVMVDLREAGYPMSAGIYHVTFTLDLGLFPYPPYPEDRPLPPEGDPRVLHSVTSNTVTITVGPE